MFGSITWVQPTQLHVSRIPVSHQPSEASCGQADDRGNAAVFGCRWTGFSKSMVHPANAFSSATLHISRLLLVSCLVLLLPLQNACAAPSPSAMDDLKQTPPEIREKSSERALKVGRALAERRAIMFGTFWCPYCDMERQALGREVINGRSSSEDPSGKRQDPLVRYVECDRGGVGQEADLCSKLGVRSYPTWALVNESKEQGGLPFKLIPGTKGLRGLEQLVGLPSPPEPDAVAPPISKPSGAREVAVAKAVADGGATFYGTYWCPACDVQRQLFGKDAWKFVPYVECDPRAAVAQPGRCNNANVQAIPLWVMRDGSRHEGVQSLEQLEALLQTPAVNQGRVPTPQVVLPMPKPGDKCEDCKVDGLAKI
mmetsp:Transcript_55858/g.110992  ORF Transcript_55858/g.110992 Transcript_55858/m.110992 type:complete len:370 (+) Transcript_55858:122-1231(+)